MPGLGQVTNSSLKKERKQKSPLLWVFTTLITLTKILNAGIIEKGCALVWNDGYLGCVLYSPVFAVDTTRVVVVLVVTNSECMHTWRAHSAHDLDVH